MFAQAAISGSGVVEVLVYVLVIGICLGLLWFAGKYFAGKFNAPPMFMTVWNAIFVLVIVLALINFLLGLVGHPMYKWTK